MEQRPRRHACCLKVTGAGMTAKILSVNVSEVKEIPYRGSTVTTGIFKVPVKGPVRVRKLNIDGDDQADWRVHGGYDMAVCAYPIEHYSFWQEELGVKSFQSAPSNT